MAYTALFGFQERLLKNNAPYLPFPLPISIQKISWGYLHQIAGEMHFVKTNVFLGTIPMEYPTDNYKESLAENFAAMAELHPQFIDTYYLCESSLSDIGPEQTRQANKVLEKGIKAMPNNWVLPFFKGFNLFYRLLENQEAAKTLSAASKLPDAPSWFGHLASILAANGGDIYGGLILLKAMLTSEQDESMRERYRKHVQIFEEALSVQKAISSFYEKYDTQPRSLEELIPEYILKVPEFEDNFSLSYNPPDLRLIRPIKAGQNN